jgi:hypothetical protein
MKRFLKRFIVEKILSDTDSERLWECEYRDEAINFTKGYESKQPNAKLVIWDNNLNKIIYIGKNL